MGGASRSRSRRTPATTSTDVVVDGVNEGAVAGYTFTNVTANHTIAASFAINTYTITAGASAGGSIIPVGSGQSSTTGRANRSRSRRTPATTSRRRGRRGDAGAITSCNFTSVTANHTIAAYFSINVYTITASASAGGTITPSGALSVNYGGSQSFAIAPNTGYHIDSVLVDGVNAGAITSRNFTDVSANHTIAAYFSINIYTHHGERGGRRARSRRQGAVSVNYGGSQSFTIAPNTGYHIDSVVVDGVTKERVASRQFRGRDVEPHDRGVLRDQHLHDHGQRDGRWIDIPVRSGQRQLRGRARPSRSPRTPVTTSTAWWSTV